MTPARSAVALLVAALVVSACGDDESSSLGADGTRNTVADATVPESALAGSWRLVSGTVDGAAVALVDGWDVTLTIDGDQVGGTAACNGYGGTADIGDGSLQVGELGWTEMACEQDVMQLEQSYLQSLPDLTSWAIGGEVLTLTGPNAEWLFDPLAPAPDQEIAGTTWVLDTVIEGDAASNSPIMSSATLRLAADGTLMGSTGCRRLEGEWIVAGAEIVFASFSAIDDPTAGVCSPESAELDGFIISVLEGGFAVELEGERMTLMAPGDEGLSYIAG